MGIYTQMVAEEAGERGHKRGVNEHSMENNGPAGVNRHTRTGANGDDGRTVTKINDSKKATTSSNNINTVLPPKPPSLLPKSAHMALFGIIKQKAIMCQELKLSIKFPQSKGKNGNDIGLFFKHFMTVLFLLSSNIQLLK